MKNGVLGLLLCSVLLSCEQSPEAGSSSQKARLSGLIYVWNSEETPNENDPPYDRIFAVLESGDAIWHDMGTRRFVKKKLPESDVEVLFETLMNTGGSYSKSKPMKPYLPEAFSEWPTAGLTCFVDGAPTRNFDEDQGTSLAEVALTEFIARNFTADETGLTSQRWTSPITP